MSYYVFYQRDLATEQSRQYGTVELYDNLKLCEDKQSAAQFAYAHLPARVIRQPTEIEEQGNYFAAVQHHGKFTRSFYDGSTDSLTSYDVHPVTRETLEGTITSLAREKHAKKIYFGIEEKLF